MTITEARRQHLYELTRERLDEEAAETLMEYIASVNSAELATKSDVHALRSELYEMQSRYITWLLASQGVLIAAIATATSVIIAVLK